MSSHQDDSKEGHQSYDTPTTCDREIISIGLGTCGNRISSGFWHNVCDEHNLNLDGTLNSNVHDHPQDEYIWDNTRINTYFRELKDCTGKYIARHIIADLDETTIDRIRASAIGSLFSPDQYVYSNNSAHDLFPVGYNSCIIDDVLDEIRREAEQCNSLQGFKLIHSVGGGTGSGLTSYLAQLLKDNFYSKLITSYTVYPSNRASDIVIEPFNFVLSMPSILAYHDMNCCIDNETLFDYSDRLFRTPSPNFSDLNHYICHMISASTAGIRFKGSMNMDLRKMATNLVPFPRLKFLSISDAPMMYKKAQKYTNITVESLITQLFHRHQFLSNIEVGAESHGMNGIYLAASVIVRGQPSSEWEIEHSLHKTLGELRYSGEALHAIPNPLHATLVYQGIPGNSLAATLFANNTAIKGVFIRNLRNFRKMYKKKGYLHYYTSNGTVVEDFEEAMNEIDDLVEEYKDREDQPTQMYDVDDFEPQFNAANRKKLEKNQGYFNEFGVKKKGKKKRKMKPKSNKKVYIRGGGGGRAISSGMRGKKKVNHRNKENTKRGRNMNTNRNRNGNRKGGVQRQRKRNGNEVIKIMGGGKRKVINGKKRGNNNDNRGRDFARNKKKGKTKGRKRKRKVTMSSDSDDFEEESSDEDSDSDSDTNTDTDTESDSDSDSSNSSSGSESEDESSGYASSGSDTKASSTKSSSDSPSSTNSDATSSDSEKTDMTDSYS